MPNKADLISTRYLLCLHCEENGGIDQPSIPGYQIYHKNIVILIIIIIIIIMLKILLIVIGMIIMTVIINIGMKKAKCSLHAYKQELQN